MQINFFWQSRIIFAEFGIDGFLNLASIVEASFLEAYKLQLK